LIHVETKLKKEIEQMDNKLKCMAFIFEEHRFELSCYLFDIINAIFKYDF